MNEIFYTNLRKNQILFSRFRLEKCLSASDSGGVYLCTDTMDENKQVALKVLSASAARNSVTGERFQNEMFVHFKVKHPNVVKCKHFFRDESFIAFTMDYMDNGTLADLMAKQRLTVRQSTAVVVQLCAGLTAIHQAGVLHRDIKPENILLDMSGAAKIADFGIATIGAAAGGGEEDVIMGTLNYMAPEYIRTGYFDIRSDIYAVGLILYELVAGKLPVYGNSPLEKLMRRATEDPVRPELLRPDCPKLLSDVIMRALHKDPSQRIQSAEQMRSELHEVQEMALPGDRVRRQTSLCLQVSRFSEESGLSTDAMAALFRNGQPA